MSKKINAMVDARGLPVAITLSPGGTSDKAAAGLLALHPRAGDGGSGATMPAPIWT